MPSDTSRPICEHQHEKPHSTTTFFAAFFVGLISLAILIGAVAGYRWLSIDFTVPGQLGGADTEVDRHVGLYYTETVTEDTNQEDDERTLAFLYTVTDNTVINSNNYNRQGMNNGPVEVRASEKMKAHACLAAARV